MSEPVKPHNSNGRAASPVRQDVWRDGNELSCDTDLACDAELRAVIASNLQRLATLEAGRAPDHLYRQILAQLRVEGVVRDEPVLRLAPRQFSWARRFAWASAAAGAVLCAGLTGWLLAGFDERPDIASLLASRSIVNPSVQAPAVAESPRDWLARTASAERTAAFRALVLSERFAEPASATASESWTRTLAVDGPADRWWSRTADTGGWEVLRHSDRVFVRRSGSVGSVDQPQWTARSADRERRSPIDQLALDPVRAGAVYQVSAGANDRVAGRDCRTLTLSHAGRAGLRLWVDTKTGVRLKTERLDGEGRLVARTTVTEFRAGAGDEFPSAPVSVARPALPEAVEADAATLRLRLGIAPLRPARLPQGFDMVRRVLMNPQSGRAVLRTTYSDGLASFELYQWAGEGPAPAAVAAVPGLRRPAPMFERTLVRDTATVKIVGEDLDAATAGAVLDGLVEE